MVYDPFIKDPQPSCKDRKPTAVTGLPPSQGCVCLSGFVLDNAEDRCVDENKCGCSTPDNYYPVSSFLTVN